MDQSPVPLEPVLHSSRDPSPVRLFPLQARDLEVRTQLTQMCVVPSALTTLSRGFTSIC